MEVFSTRVSMVEDLRPERLATKWRVLYREGASGEWKVVNEGEVPESEAASDLKILVGSPDPDPGGQGGTFLRGLKPSSSYTVKFEAENADNKGVPVVDEHSFVTKPVERPEVDNEYLGYEPANTTFRLVKFTNKEATLRAKIDTNGAPSSYVFEYALSESGPWTQFGAGAVGVEPGKEYKFVEGTATGLKEETKYYIRVKASNSAGETVLDEYYKGFGGAAAGCSTVLCNFFVTGTGRAFVGRPEVRNVRTDSAFVKAVVTPHGSETQWELQYSANPKAPIEPNNPAVKWEVGKAGTVSQRAAEEAGYGNIVPGDYGVQLANLKASTTYYVRTIAKNVAGEAEVCGEENGRSVCEPASSETRAIASFTTEGPPLASASPVHGVHNGLLRFLGWVNPESEPTSAEQVIAIEGGPSGGTFTLTFDGETTQGLRADASAEMVAGALRALKSAPELGVEGANGGPYTVFFFGSSGGMKEPTIEGNGSALSPAGCCHVSVTSSLEGGIAYETRYRFQYVAEKSFAEEGWQKPQEGVEADAGSGGKRVFVGSDQPGLIAGETYHYRLAAQSNAPNIPLVTSDEETLTVPVSPQPSSEACPNDVLRSGASAHLPDCRAYERVSPRDKEGAQEPFQYKGELSNWLAVGSDGEHTVLYAQGTDYGKGPEAGQSPYLFSRNEREWGMVAGATQPEKGVRRIEPQVLSADATTIAFSSAYATSSVSESPTVEYAVGKIGGPYTHVATVPRGDTAEVEGWVAGDPDLSKLVFATQDRTLLSGAPTHTVTGSDLYEYTAQNGLRQLNVRQENGRTVTIGSCGAKIVDGLEDTFESTGRVSSPHSVSADGSSVFFEAAPGNNKCGQEATHLYIRVNGSETVDVGPFVFVAADANARNLVIQAESGSREMFLYNVESKSATPLAGLDELDVTKDDLTVSDDLTAMYYHVGEELYRYDLQARRLESLANAVPATQGLLTEVSPDGRYAYFEAVSVGGLPGGNTSAVGDNRKQAYRYDSVEHALECVSCSSGFNPEPANPSFLQSIDGKPLINGGGTPYSSISYDGDYAFFTTPATLLAEDTDVEEIAITEDLFSEYEDVAKRTSPSSDIYEWRADGVHSCTQLQGCLTLITNGRGGYKSLLLGTVNEGRDVLIYTREHLLSEEASNEGNIFDVREDGGLPGGEPPRVPCAADSCSPPPREPIDTTPSSLTFEGNGNIQPPAPSRHIKRCVRSKVLRHGKSKRVCAKKKAKTRKTRGKHRRRHHGKRTRHPATRRTASPSKP